MRLIEIWVIYYIVAHLVAGVWIAIAFRGDNILETWMIRIPVP